jgi:hypothetical protein
MGVVQVIECDMCKRLAYPDLGPDQKAVAPVGWFQVRREATGPIATLDSPACLVAWAQQQPTATSATPTDHTNNPAGQP